MCNAHLLDSAYVTRLLQQICTISENFSSAALHVLPVTAIALTAAVRVKRLTVFSI